MSGVKGSSSTPPIASSGGHTLKKVAPSQAAAADHDPDKDYQDKNKEGKRDHKPRGGHQDGAIDVSPTILHLDAGQIIEGYITGHDEEGSAVLNTTKALYTIRSSDYFYLNQALVIKITSVEKHVIGLVESIDEIRPNPLPKVGIILIGIHSPNQSGDNDLEEINKNKASSDYSSQGHKAIESNTDLDFETSSLALGIGLDQPLGRKKIELNLDIKKPDPNLDKEAETAASEAEEKFFPQNTLPSDTLSSTLEFQELDTPTPNPEEILKMGMDIWPIYQQLFKCIDKASPFLAETLKGRTQSNDQHFPHSFLFLITSLTIGAARSWLGYETSHLLDQSGNSKELDDLDWMMLQLKQILKPENNDENWALTNLALGDGNNAKAFIVLHKLSQNMDNGALNQCHFITEFDHTSFGRTQFEAILTPEKCTLYFRLPPAHIEDISDKANTLFKDCLNRSSIECEFFIENIDQCPLNFQRIIGSIEMKDTTNLV